MRRTADSAAHCGLRLLTSDGRTAACASHIIPWSTSRDDDLHYGMALRRLRRWSCGQGLLGVSAKYLMLLSGELRITHRPSFSAQQQPLRV